MLAPWLTAPGTVAVALSVSVPAAAVGLIVAATVYVTELPGGSVSDSLIFPVPAVPPVAAPLTAGVPKRSHPRVGLHPRSQSHTISIRFTV